LGIKRKDVTFYLGVYHFRKNLLELRRVIYQKEESPKEAVLHSFPYVSKTVYWKSHQVRHINKKSAKHFIQKNPQGKGKASSSPPEKKKENPREKKRGTSGKF